MIKEVLSLFDYQFWAEGGLVLFLVAFAVVTIQALLKSRREIQADAHLPLED